MAEKFIEFPNYQDCADCPLCKEAKHPGIPTRIFEVNGHDRALLVVGMAPGWNEDREGKSWIGWSGDILGKFISAMKFPDLVDVYLSNAVRCKLPKGQKNPTKTQINTCRPNLLFDIQLLLNNYKEVVILACGSDAAKAVAGVTRLGDGLKLQGLTEGTPPLQILSNMPTLFFTNHPAILYAGRKPEKVNTIQAHFMLVRRYLTGEFIPNKLQVVPELGAEVPDKISPLVTCDIETYGILKGYNQTVFTPAKSRYVDGVPYGKQVITVSFGYRDFLSKSPCKIRTPVYIFSDSEHRKLIRKWIKRVIETGGVLQGQNFKYDLLYLLVNDPLMENLLDPNLLSVDDTLIKAFLLDESQTEKGLKELCLLYGIANYRGLSVTGSKGNAKNSSDPDLLYYNALDAATALVLGEELEERIKIRYGSDSSKLGSVCSKMRNDVIWNVVGMEKAGERLDIPKLQAVNKEYEEVCEGAMAYGERLGVIFGGAGSRKSQLDFMSAAVREAGLLSDSRVERTRVKKEISVNKANVNLILQYLPDGELKLIAEQLKVYGEYSHLRNTYTNKLLTHPREGIIHRNHNTGWIYPIWYPVPSVFEKGSTKGGEKKGGTIQGRITPRKPPAQTFPRPVKACLKSRFYAGTLRTYDFSQIELRMAALLSGCPVLMKVYETKGESIHLNTTFMLYPELKDAMPIPELKDTKEYVSSKSLNFLIIYRGGPKAYQTTARSDCGLEVPIKKCKEHIDIWYAEHPVFRAWQDDQIELVAEQGYLELPTGWSRTFGKGKANAMGAVNEICNFPIQTLGSGQIPLSSQFVILQGLRRNRMRAVICSNKYDSITIDTPYNETEAVDELAGKALTNPPLMGILKEKLGRTIPIEYELKVL